MLVSIGGKKMFNLLTLAPSFPGAPSGPFSPLSPCDTQTVESYN